MESLEYRAVPNHPCSQHSQETHAESVATFYFHLAFTLKSILLQRFFFPPFICSLDRVSLSLFSHSFLPLSLSNPIKSPGSVLSCSQPLFALTLISGLGSDASPISDASPHLPPLNVSSKQLSALPSSLGKRFPCLPQSHGLVLSQIPLFKQISLLNFCFAATPSELLCDSAAAERERCHVKCV